MTHISKGKSPFYPGQPVPVELFVGRNQEIQHIMERGVGQVAAGKPIAMFVQGEYGIGKSSIAGFVQLLAERDHGLHGIYATLGAGETLNDVGAAVLRATLLSGALHSGRTDTVRNWLAKYIGEQTLFGITVHAEALNKDAPTIASGIVPFLSEVFTRLQDTGIRGLFLILDEINGITANPKFAHFVKDMVEANARLPKPVPLLLMLCGVEERRREMIRNHQPVDRIFDVIEIESLSQVEMRNFFSKAFESVQVQIEPEAMELLTHYSAGYPKIMHLLGDAAFWLDRDGHITLDEASDAVLQGADEVGKKYVDQQVYKALRSRDYHSILGKIAKTGQEMTFQKADVAEELTEAERKKFSNFLTKMKKLKVIRAGDVRGEYVFNVRMVRLYIWLDSLRRGTE